MNCDVWVCLIPPLRDRFLQASHDLQRLQKHLSWGFLNPLNTMVEPDFPEKSYSWVMVGPPPPLSTISCYYVYTNIQMAVPSVFWAYQSIGDDPRVSWACLKWYMSVFLMPPIKIDFYRLPMTCQDSKSIFSGGYSTFWTRWSSQISQKKSRSWVMQGPPPPLYPLYLTVSHFNPRPIL